MYLSACVKALVHCHYSTIFKTVGIVKGSGTNSLYTMQRRTKRQRGVWVCVCVFPYNTLCKLFLIRTVLYMCIEYHI